MATINLGEIEQTIRDVGGDELLAKLGLIDSKSKAIGAQSIVVVLDAPNATGVAAAINDIGEQSKKTASDIDALNKKFPLKPNPDAIRAAKAAAADEAAAQRIVNREIASSIQQYQLFARTVDVGSKQAVVAMRQLAQEQLAYIQSLGATEVQQLRLAAAVQQFEKRVERGVQVVPQLNRNVRSGANAIAGLAIAASTGGGSLAGMATQAGLAGNVLAQEFAPAKWAGYAAGVGAAIVVLAALVGILKRLHEEASKPSELAVGRIAAIKQLTLAEAEYTKRRQEADRARAADLTMRQKLSIGGIPSPTAGFTREARERSKAEGLETEALKRFTDLRGDILKGHAAATIEITVEGLAARNAAAEAADNARLAKETASFALGQRNLEQFYDERLRLIERQRQREVAALSKRQELLRQPVAGATEPEARLRLAEADRIAPKIRTINARANQQTTEEIEQRRAKREQLNRAVLQFEQREQEAAGDASKARIAIAQQESIEIARVLVQQGVAPLDAERRRQAQLAFEQQKLQFEQLQTEANRIFDQIANKRAQIQTDVERGVFSELEGQKKVAEAEREQVKALDDILARMAALALALSNPILANAFNQLQQQIRGLNNFVSPLERDVRSGLQSLEELMILRGKAIAVAFRKELEKAGGKVSVGFAFRVESVAIAAAELEQALKDAVRSIPGTVASALADGFSSAFTKGSGKNFFEAFGNALLVGVGNTIVQLGSAMLTYGLIMAAFAPLAVFTPFAGAALSAPAAIAAGTGLIALGAALGAIAANNTGRRTGSGGSSAASRSPNQDIIKHIWLNPDRTERTAEDMARATVRSGSSLATPLPIINTNVTVIGERDLRAQRSLVNMVNRGVRRNIRIG